MKTAWYLGILSALTLNMTAYAAVFPDVPDNHLYREAIEKLVGSQVINGNPDGTFKPEEAVNRAAMLKMLYKAAGRSPDPSRGGSYPTRSPASPKGSRCARERPRLAHPREEGRGHWEEAT